MELGSTEREILFLVEEGDTDAAREVCRREMSAAGRDAFFALMDDAMKMIRNLQGELRE